MKEKDAEREFMENYVTQRRNTLGLAHKEAERISASKKMQSEELPVNWRQSRQLETQLYHDAMSKQRADERQRKEVTQVAEHRRRETWVDVMRNERNMALLAAAEARKAALRDRESSARQSTGRLGLLRSRNMVAPSSPSPVPSPAKQTRPQGSVAGPSRVIYPQAMRVHSAEPRSQTFVIETPQIVASPERARPSPPQPHRRLRPAWQSSSEALDQRPESEYQFQYVERVDPAGMHRRQEYEYHHPQPESTTLSHSKSPPKSPSSAPRPTQTTEQMRKKKEEEEKEEKEEQQQQLVVEMKKKEKDQSVSEPPSSLMSDWQHSAMWRHFVAEVAKEQVQLALEQVQKTNQPPAIAPAVISSIQNDNNDSGDREAIAASEGEKVPPVAMDTGTSASTSTDTAPPNTLSQQEREEEQASKEVFAALLGEDIAAVAATAASSSISPSHPPVEQAVQSEQTATTTQATTTAPFILTDTAVGDEPVAVVDGCCSPIVWEENAPLPAEEEEEEAISPQGRGQWVDEEDLELEDSEDVKVKVNEEEESSVAEKEREKEKAVPREVGVSPAPPALESLPMTPVGSSEGVTPLSEDESHHDVIAPDTPLSSHSLDCSTEGEESSPDTYPLTAAETHPSHLAERERATAREGGDVTAGGDVTSDDFSVSGAWELASFISAASQSGGDGMKDELLRSHVDRKYSETDRLEDHTAVGESHPTLSRTLSDTNHMVDDLPYIVPPGKSNALQDVFMQKMNRFIQNSMERQENIARMHGQFPSRPVTHVGWSQAPQRNSNAKGGKPRWR
jgi:hypothetical protein